MNIMITKEEHIFLRQRLISQYEIGSRMYGVATEKSDTDLLCIYGAFENELRSGLPNIHQFQYKDVENNIDYIYTSDLQFWKNFYSGDSTINVDVILFGNTEFSEVDRLAWCRSYKIIKAFIDFAKRDLKQAKQGEFKLIHASRSLYCAECLILKKLPLLGDIREIYNQVQNITVLKEREEYLRKLCNGMYDGGELDSYYIPLIAGNTLINKLYSANNTKEFHYE